MHEDVDGHHVPLVLPRIQLEDLFSDNFVTSWKAEATTAGIRSQVKQDQRGLCSCYYDPSVRWQWKGNFCGTNSYTVRRACELSTYSKWNTADGDLHSVFSPHTLGSRCSCRDKSIKCSILVQVCRWHFIVQSVVKCLSFRDRVLPIVNEYAYMQYVVFSLPRLKCSSQAPGSTPILWLFLGAKSGHPVIWGEIKTARNLQGFKCTLAVLKCWGICHEQPG